MSLKKLAAGSAYDYLTRQVAVQDAAVPAGGLSSYYTERGEAPGTWVGTGLAGLGIRPGEVVTEEQMQHLFGIGSIRWPTSFVQRPWRQGCRRSRWRRRAGWGHRSASAPAPAWRPSGESLRPVAKGGTSRPDGLHGRPCRMR
ncbi:MAG: relaxase domain-containing protein [Micropruina sp.]|nr:MAG: relaxase domain-containing protein [Micropruina sp.]